jgi:alpha-tubulin suppressor-like RCC1 family protein
VVQIAVMPELTLGLRSDGKVLAAGRHNAVLNTLDTVRAMACFGSRRQVFVMADGTVRIHIRGSEFLPEPLGEIRVFTDSVRYSVLDRYATHSLPVVTARRALGTFALGLIHTLTLGEKGTVTAAGADDGGQCGIATYAGAVQVAAGPYHSAAILADGSLAITGRNPDGRCDFRTLNRELDTVGASAEESRHGAVPALGEPDPTLLPYAWLQVACGHEHTVALRSDGRVYATGANPDGRCDTRQWRDVDYVACGVRHTVALRSDGTCVAAGDNRYGQCDVSLWKNIVMVAAGEFHTVGLRADGRVEVAGDNRKGQCRTEDLRDVVSVACLPEATLCIRADGRVVIRGGDGELDKAVEALREVVAIHTCEHRVAVLTADRRVIYLP